MSMDGVSWAPIDGSLRTIDLFGTLDSFATLSSRGATFPAGARVRWQMYASNDMTIEAPDDQTTPNGVVGGFSVLWELIEVA
ncbi:hypothetical protein phiV141_41 [Vibrio phage phiV141]|uniref:Uncharacterized protein n=1 Tax=Vibrio phage phiV141 TaxID=2723905 RepID=A0A7D7EMQ9_9CAUD|nr:hypothetical protein phiV141_41 [Vibrio phage phiV141]